MPWLDDILEWLTQPENLDKILLAILGPILVAFLIWLVRISKTTAHRLLWLALQFREPLAEQIAQYQSNLNQQSFQIKHAWMKEGQTLEDILVPVNIGSDGLADGIEDWSILLCCLDTIG